MACEFIEKLKSIIQKQQELIRWNREGTEICVLDNEKFSNDLLPRYFRHNRLQSFVRQMNMYGFKKIGRRKNTTNFKNKYFKKGEEQSYNLIQRRKKEAQDPSNVQPKSESSFFVSHETLRENSMIFQLFESLLTFENQTMNTTENIKSQILQIQSQIQEMDNKKLKSEMKKLKNQLNGILGKQRDIERKLERVQQDERLLHKHQLIQSSHNIQEKDSTIEHLLPVLSVENACFNELFDF